MIQLKIYIHQRRNKATIGGNISMNSNPNDNEKKEFLKSKGLFYIGVFILLIIVTAIVILSFLSLFYYFFRNS